MRDPLAVLARLADAGVDEAKREVGEAQAAVAAIEAEIAALDGAVAREAAGTSPDLHERQLLGRYLAATRAERERQFEALAKLEQELARRQVMLAERRIEQKRLQMLLERQRWREHEQRERRAQHEMEELASIRRQFGR